MKHCQFFNGASYDKAVQFMNTLPQNAFDIQLNENLMYCYNKRYCVEWSVPDVKEEPKKKKKKQKHSYGRTQRPFDIGNEYRGSEWDSYAWSGNDF